MSQSELRLGLAFPAPEITRDYWSGTPYGLRQALAAASAELCEIPAQPRGVLARGASLSLRLRWRSDLSIKISPQMAALRTRSAARALKNVAHLDGIVQISTEYFLPPVAPVATYEDQTTVQALPHYQHLQAAPARIIELRNQRQRAVYEQAHACCVTSHAAAESVVSDYGIARDKVHVVGVGRNFTPASGPRNWERPNFLFVGLDWARKNGPGVVRAFTRLRGRFPDASLNVVGRHPPISGDGIIGHGELRLDDPVMRQRLEGLFASATCFVLPSQHEPSALGYVEAAAAGLPIIGTKVGGSNTLIGDGGVLVDPDDEDALLTAMEELAEPATAARVGEAARRHASLFTWEAVAARIIKALDLAARGGSEVPPVPVPPTSRC